MLIYIKPAAATLVGFLACIYVSGLSATDSFIIDDENLIFEPLYTTAVYGFRAFPTSKIVMHDWKSGLSIRADVLARSLEAVIPGEEVTLQDLHATPRLVDPVHSYTPVFISADYEEQTTLAAPKLSVPSSGRYDSRLIVSAFGTELVSREPNQFMATPVERLEFIELNPDVAMDLLTVYGGLNSLINYESARIPTTLNQFDNTMAQYSGLYAVAKIPIGNVRMERPLVLKPTTLGIEVPEEWEDTYNLRLVILL
jgi:hypothetical protein